MRVFSKEIDKKCFFRSKNDIFARKLAVKQFLHWNIIYLGAILLFDFLFLLNSLFISGLSIFRVCNFDWFLRFIIWCNFVLLRLFMFQIRLWISTFSIASRLTEVFVGSYFKTWWTYLAFFFQARPVFNAAFSARTSFILSCRNAFFP